MTRNPHIEVPSGLRWREHRIQSRNRAEVAEKVALRVMCPRFCAIARLCVCSFDEREVRTRVNERARDIVGEGIGESVTEGAEDATGRGSGGASAPVGFPDVTGSLPIQSECVVDHGFDSIYYHQLSMLSGPDKRTYAMSLGESY